MEVVLLGTGSADGWPNPFCDCRSCRWASAAGEIRAQTAALVDDTVLIDCGPEVPRAAVRCGRTLAGVRHILFTHADFDHLGPAALLMRHWAGRSEPLQVLGPPAVVTQCRDWVGPDDPIEVREVAPGDVVALSTGHTVRVLAAAHTDALGGAAVLYDVSRCDTRILWATDTGPLPAATHSAIAGAGFDAVFLEQTFGTYTGHGTAHHDLPAFRRTVTQLRESGAVHQHTDIVAVHLSHHNPPGVELAQALAVSGARAGRDGEVIRIGGVPWSSRSVVLGGVRSGKSAYAESLLTDEPRVTYLATGGARPGDREWVERIQRHRARRPKHWHTIETVDVAVELRTADAPVLLDCLGTWLTARMDRHEIWDGGPLDAVHADIDELVAAWQQCGVPAVAVSNEVGSGVVPDTASGRLFRDLLGVLNMRIAAVSDHTVLMVAGVPVQLPQTGVSP
ncbi:bifunctional adenosylcobinamide kinase/adenosylcobinamide-phosphate guanylyltransferase [Mycolicibacterium thermoresistibile]